MKRLLCYFSLVAIVTACLQLRECEECVVNSCTFTIAKKSDLVACVTKSQAKVFGKYKIKASNIAGCKTMESYLKGNLEQQRNNKKKNKNLVLMYFL